LGALAGADFFEETADLARLALVFDFEAMLMGVSLEVTDMRRAQNAYSILWRAGLSTVQVD
jgi:hypothetical protein